MDYKPRFLAALLAQKQAQGKSLSQSDYLATCQVIAEIIEAETAERVRAECAEAAKAAKPARKPKKALETDAEWIASLEADPALSGLNVRREIDRCGLWYRQNVSKVGAPSRRRIMNWLLKSERVVDLKAMGGQHATGLKVPAPDGPEGWVIWLNTELSLISEEHPGHGQLLFAMNSRKFSAMPASWQARCNAQLKA